MHLKKRSDDDWSWKHRLFTATTHDGTEIDLTWYLYGVVAGIILLILF